MALTMHLTCPVRTCSEELVVVMDGDAYGAIRITGQGCAEITMTNSEHVRAHINAHYADGSAFDELRRHDKEMARLYQDRLQYWSQSSTF